MIKFLANSKSRAFLAASVVGVFLVLAPLVSTAQAVSRSKTAYNETQSANAESVLAHLGDVITYTLRYVNTTGVTQTVTIEDDIADILFLADLINLGGAAWQGSTLRYPSVNVAAGSSLERTFQVRVKNIPAGTSDLVMSNFYGNGVDIKVLPLGTSTPPPAGTVKGAATAPPTGPKENLALWFALLVTGGMYVYKKSRRAKIVNAIS